jgi:FkbM family methyltransferase
MPTRSLRQRYWSFRSALRDPDTYPTLFRDLPKAAVLRWLRLTTEVGGVKVRLGPFCSLLVAIEMVAGRYESQERTLLQGCLDDQDVVLELGTGIGVVAVLCARRLGSDRVFTFEANPGLIPTARETFQLNDVTPRLENCVLGSAEGEMSFHVEKDFWSSSTIKRSANARAIKVPVHSFSATIRKVQPTVLIVDIEGGEASLFDAAELGGVRKIMIELHPHVIGPVQTQRVRDVLRRAGFALVRELSNGTNVLFART